MYIPINVPLNVPDAHPYHFHQRIAKLNAAANRMLPYVTLKLASSFHAIRPCNLTKANFVLVPHEATLLIKDLCHYISDLNSGTAQHDSRSISTGASKKRKFDGDSTNGVDSQRMHGQIGQPKAHPPTTYHPKGQYPYLLQSRLPDLSAEIDLEVSVTVPVRRKCRLRMITVKESMSRSGSEDAAGLSFMAKAETAGESFGVVWNDIDQIIAVPIPEATKPQHYFIVIPKPPRSLVSYKYEQQGAADPTLPEPIIFSVPDTKTKDQDPDEESQYVLFSRLFDKELQGYSKTLTIPSSDEFESKLVQAHKKGEKSWHVKAFRGSKEGFLYFLPTGILFGFRKPIVFFFLHSITSISYSSILQRTFNLDITVRLSASDSTYFACAGSGGNAALTSKMEKEEDSTFEFSMLDQADYEGIDSYIKRHRLNDQSLAAERRARWFGVNDRKKEKGAEGEDTANGAAAAGNTGGVSNGGEEEESELAKAERELQDREDEEEEDYDPSGGESEGSGSDSEEEDEEGEEGAAEYEDDDGEEASHEG